MRNYVTAVDDIDLWVQHMCMSVLVNVSKGKEIPELLQELCEDLI